MASKLRVRRSATKTIQDAGSLLFGELVYTDVNGNLYIADKDDAPQQIAVKGTTAAFTSDLNSKLNGIEAGADVTDSTNVDAAGAVMATDYDAHTILAATSDNAPQALTVGEQTLVGRVTGGAIAALSAGDVRTLLNVENGADVTDADNVAAAGAVMESDTSTANMAFVVDEDAMTSNSATKVPTQQSVKAYVDAQVGAAIASEMTYKGGYDADTNEPNLDAGTLVAIAKGDMYTVTQAGTFFTEAVEPGDVLIANVAGADALDEWTVVNKNLGSVVATGRKVDTTEGLTGGGDLTQDRTLKLAFDGLAALAAADVATANDVLAIYDLSATTHKKITVTDLLDGGTF